MTDFVQLRGFSLAATIKLLTHSSTFQFLWLKSVHGFNPRVHCEECLKGKLQGIIPTDGGRKRPAGLRIEGDIDVSSPYVYLCAVVPPAKGIEENVHLLCQPDPDSTVEYENEHLSVTMTGLRRLEIEPLPPHARAHFTDELFWRCRNFQAGWMLFPEARTLNEPG